MTLRKKRVHIYKSRLHIAVTLGVIVLPFVFLLVFSRLAHVATGQLFSDVLVSLVRIIVAYILFAMLGWVLATLFYKGKRSIIALPIFDVLQSLPVFALLPIAIYFWGASEFTVIFFLGIEILWPIFFSILSSLKLIKHEWEEAATMARLHGFNYFKKFLLPVSIPGLITGSIIGLGNGWEALVATEIIVNVKIGMGNFFQVFSQNPTITVLGILGLLILIFSINKLIWLPLLDWSHRVMEE